MRPVAVTKRTRFNLPAEAAAAIPMKEPLDLIVTPRAQRKFLSAATQ
jgi:hypothetical protein